MARPYFAARVNADPGDLIPELLETWIISDLHLGHVRLEVGGPLGGVRPRGFTGQIVDMLRRTVQWDDDLLTLGDTLVGWPLGTPMPWIPGRLWTVPGNHESHTKIDMLIDRGWRILPPFETVHRGWVISFTHEPVDVDALLPNQVSVHGHIHQRPEPTERHINVSCEPLGYRPRRLGDLLDARIDRLGER